MEPPDACLGTQLRCVFDMELGVVQPAGERQSSVPGVQRDDEPLAQRRGEPLERGRLGKGRRADDDARCPRGEERLCVGKRSDPARRLNRHGPCRRGQPSDELGTNLTAACAVEIDDVDENRVGARVPGDEAGGVSRLVRDAVEVAPLESHRLVGEDVDRRYDKESAGTSRAGRGHRPRDRPSPLSPDSGCDVMLTC